MNYIYLFKLLLLFSVTEMFGYRMVSAALKALTY